MRDEDASDDGARRRHGGDRPDRYRTPYSRDLDRLLYSSAFRRLSGVTQVVSADETLLFHNRLTHTLKVAQVAKRLSERLLADFRDRVAAADGLSPEAAEAAALAHDLGHPPFGHIAEEVLRHICEQEGRNVNGYEGNAQTFRIVTRLSQRVEQPGLNLTRRTLRGILKYPWIREGEYEGERKWGAYTSERSDFDFAIGGTSAAGRSLEAQIMDWADDITYAVHDLEDFYRAGLSPLGRLQYDELEVSKFIANATTTLEKYALFDGNTAAAAFHDLLKVIPFVRPYDGSNEVRRSIHATSSNLITRFITETRVKPNGRDLDIPVQVWHEVNVLKQLTWHYVINSPDLASIQEGQKNIIGEVFERLFEWSLGERKPARLPTRLREILKSLKSDTEAVAALDDDPQRIVARAVADYIASLTEPQATELYGRLNGHNRSSVLHGWVRA